MPFVKWNLEPIFVNRPYRWSSLPQSQPQLQPQPQVSSGQTSQAGPNNVKSTKSSQNNNSYALPGAGGGPNNSNCLPPPKLLVPSLKSRHDDAVGPTTKTEEESNANLNGLSRNNETVVSNVTVNESSTVSSGVSNGNNRPQQNGDVEEENVGGVEGDDEVIIMEEDVEDVKNDLNKRVKSPCEVKSNLTKSNDQTKLVNLDPSGRPANCSKMLLKVPSEVSEMDHRTLIVEPKLPSSQKSSNGEDQILTKIQCRSMVGIIRQMAALLNATDQLFSEITDDCRRLLDRSVQLRNRVVKLNTTVDRLNVSVRQTAPQIANILLCQNLPPEYHWRSTKTLDCSLFSSEQRPLSVRNVYARAHAPGDVHLSCHLINYSMLPSFGCNSMISRRHLAKLGGTTSNSSNRNINQQSSSSSSVAAKRRSEFSMITTATAVTSGGSSGSCHCNCGQCHPVLTNGITRTDDETVNLVPGKVGVITDKTSSPDKSDNLVGVNNNNQAPTDSEYGTTRSCDCCRVSSNSSSSSVVTWSSITSSIFEPHTLADLKDQPFIINGKPSSGHHGGHPGGGQHQHLSSCKHYTAGGGGRAPFQRIPSHRRPRVETLSSFSSAEYYLPESKTIDDFFRKNNVDTFEQSLHSGVSRPNQPSLCTCSCATSSVAATVDLKSDQIGEDRLISIDSYSQIGGTNSRIQEDQQARIAANASCDNSQTMLASSNHTINSDNNYWNWWWSDDEHRRWSSALAGSSSSSPLKPTKLDETSVWIRENIETRRPESVVFKSGADIPAETFLERALSPLCASSSIRLRNPTNTGNQTNDPSTTTTMMPRLKRRWSLFPVRRSKNVSSDSETAASKSSHKIRFNRNRTSLPPHNRNRIQTTTTSPNGSNQPELPEPDSPQPTEVVLFSPDERLKLLAEKFCNTTVVPIDTSGRTFERMSRTRRSLIHTDFHISRHKIHSSTSRSRSKSPAKRTAARLLNDVSPYAYGTLGINPARDAKLASKNVAERGCQTEENNNGRCRVPVEVHRNASHSEIYEDLITTDYDDEDKDYVVIVNARRKQMMLMNGGHGNLNGKLNAGIMSTIDRNNKNEGRSSLKSSEIVTRRLYPSQTVTSGNANDNQRLVATALTTLVNNSGQIVEKMNQQQQHYNKKKSVGSTVVRHRNHHQYDQATGKGHHHSNAQNGGRSSSGNWSAATSDLLQSSSTSSSPLHIPTFGSKQPGDDENDRISPTTTLTTTTSDSINCQTSNKQVLSAKSSGSNNGVEQLSNNNEEAESVYSVDNDGYYTSMHTDSGLYFGTFPLATSLSLGGNGGAAGASGAARFQTGDRNLALMKKRLKDKKRFERIQEECASGGALNNISSSAIFSNDILKRWNGRLKPEVNGSGDLNVSKTNNLMKKKERIADLTGVNTTNELLKAANQFGSNLSINSILSNSDATSTTIDADLELRTNQTDNQTIGTGVGGGDLTDLTDFDCSVSHCSHQASGDCGQPKMIMMMSTSTSGAYDNHVYSHHNDDVYDDDDEETLRSSSSSETLHDERHLEVSNTGSNKRNNRRIQDDHTHNHHHYYNRSGTIGSSSKKSYQRSGTLNEPQSQQPPQQQHSRYLHRQSSMHRSLTESSSNSSSCRKLPPPPPPPRVSSMLRTLQKYADDAAAAADANRKRRSTTKYQNSHIRHHHQCTDEDNDADADDNADTLSTMSESVRTTQSDMNDIASSIVSHHPSESETNSEYFRHQNEQRRRRLFLDVDSARSYPPLSFIGPYDQQTDTATTVSISSSAYFEDDDEFELIDQSRNQLNSANDGCGNGADSQSSRTITPDNSKPDTTIPDVYPQQQQQQQFEDNRTSMSFVNNRTGSLDRSSVSGNTLEGRRHLSSPLPPPKLASFTINNNNNNNQQQQQQKQSQQRRSTSSSSSSPIVQQRGLTGPGTTPKPKPRNSLHLSSSPPTNALDELRRSYVTSHSNESENNVNKSANSNRVDSGNIGTETEQSKQNSTNVISEYSVPKSSKYQQPETKLEDTKDQKNVENSTSDIDQNSQKQSPNVSRVSPQISPKSTTSSVSSLPSPPHRPLTTEEILIVLHNSKKKHNIRTEPTIFPSNRSPGSNSSGTNQTSPRLTPPKQNDGLSVSVARSPQSQPSAAVHSAIVNGQQQSPETQSLKRRSWTGGHSMLDQNLSNGSASTLGGNSQSLQPRTRQSLALDRLGPIRPTTLNDFKRLLAQVRSPTTPSPSSPASSATFASSSSSSSKSPVSSIYTALQEVLKPSQTGTNGSSAATSSSSGISSPSMSALSSPLSPTLSSRSSLGGTPVSSPERKLHPQHHNNLNGPQRSPQRSMHYSIPIRSPSSATSRLISSPSVTSTSATTNANTGSTTTNHNYYSAASSTIGANSPPPAAVNTSMNNFIKKFSKSKFLSKSYSGNSSAIDRARSAVARLDVCPTIPEDDGSSDHLNNISGSNGDIVNNNNNNINNNNNNNSPTFGSQKIDEKTSTTIQEKSQISTTSTESNNNNNDDVGSNAAIYNNNNNNTSTKHNCTSTWV